MKKNIRYAAGIVFITLAVVAVLGIHRGFVTVPMQKNEEPIDLTWFSDVPTWNPLSAGSQTEAAVITEKTNVNILYNIPEDDGDQRLILMMVNGTVPDIISVSDEKMRAHLIASEAVWNLEELLEQYVPDSHLLSTYPADVKEQLVLRDGGWYGLASDLYSPDNKAQYPQAQDTYINLQTNGNNLGIIWNETLLKRLDLYPEIPQTETQVLQAFKKAVEKEATVNAQPVIPLLIDGIRYQDTTLPVLYDTFGVVFQEDVQTGTYLLPDSFHQTLQFLNRAVRTSLLQAEQLRTKPYNINRLLNTGRVLCYIGDVSAAEIDPSQWVSAGVILSDLGTGPVFKERPEIDLGSTTTFVSKTCENPEAAALWLDNITSEDGMRLFSRVNGSSWWPLRNEDWYYAEKPFPDETEKAREALLCAYAAAPEIIVQTAADTDAQESAFQTAVGDLSKKQMSSIIMAESDEIFERAYKRLQDALYEIAQNQEVE